MSQIAVVGNDVLAIALARQLATGPAAVVLHEPMHSTPPAGEEVASLRLLHADRGQVARDHAALQSWEALEEETGVDVLTPVHAIDVGPPATVATLLHATSLIAPARVLYPREAARQWREIRFDGLVAYQPAASRISLAAARQALLRSAVAWGVRVDRGRAARVRAGRRGNVQVLVDGRWHSYDAAVVIADSAERSELAGLPTAPEHRTVLSVEPIGAIHHWPSVVHHPGLPQDPDGHRLPGCGAEVNDGLLDLTLADDAGQPAAAAGLWEYATRWLPGTIVSTKRVRSESRSAPRLDTTLGRLAVTAPLGGRDRGLAPVVAAELARDLLDAVALDYPTTRAS
ncbi:MAG: sarcosine oxidase [Pseudonocardiales bacterium]|nr:sarcosine oxidase [Pseudonocardiales bacterium]